MADFLFPDNRLGLASTDDEDPGPAAARAVCWQLRESPPEDIYEVLEMLALLPGQEDRRRTAFPMRDLEKEASCRPTKKRDSEYVPK